MHLRQQLRNKETTQSETKQNGTDNFVNGNTAPDVSRVCEIQYES